LLLFSSKNENWIKTFFFHFVKCSSHLVCSCFDQPKPKFEPIPKVPKFWFVFRFSVAFWTEIGRNRKLELNRNSYRNRNFGRNRKFPITISCTYPFVTYLSIAADIVSSKNWLVKIKEKERQLVITNPLKMTQNITNIIT
jgi:hypothetical protein